MGVAVLRIVLNLPALLAGAPNFDSNVIELSGSGTYEPVAIVETCRLYSSSNCCCFTLLWSRSKETTTGAVILSRSRLLLMASAGDAGESVKSADYNCSSSSQSQLARRTGRCKWFNIVKGFGFITPDDGQPDVFLHQTVIQMKGFRSLAEGEPVEFEAKSCEKGFEATLVCGPDGSDCSGTERRPVGKRKSRKIRCYNCGEFANHVAAKCPIGNQPKRCHHCKADSHLIADCPDRQQQSSELQTSGSSPQSSASQQQQQ